MGSKGFPCRPKLCLRMKLFDPLLLLSSLYYHPYEGITTSSSVPPAPHLPASLVKNIGTEFLKMSVHVVLPKEMFPPYNDE